MTGRISQNYQLNIGGTQLIAWAANIRVVLVLSTKSGILGVSEEVNFQ